MPIGVLINSGAVLLGGLVGAVLGIRIPERLRSNLPITFGIASMAIGVNYIVEMKTLPAVVLALIVGVITGELLRLEDRISKIAEKTQTVFGKYFTAQTAIIGQVGNEDSMGLFVSVLVLFCASGTGIFGALTSGMTGDHSILLAKSILDFFTAIIFATSLGYLVAVICVPQFAILLTLFATASFILPLTTPQMIADFTALGGIIMLTTGLRVSGIKSYPIANMLPALLFVMPLTYLWVKFIG